MHSAFRLIYITFSRLLKRTTRLIGCEAQSPPRAANPFATHVPVLIAMSKVVPIRRVLEFGCGRFSTLMFLDRAVFPDLMQLDSYEDNPDWAREISAAAHDRRLHLELVPHPVSDSAARVPLEGYDLIFIDDSMCWQDRAATIRRVAERCYSSSIVVMHDYEMQPYREAALSFPRRYAFTAFNPATGIAWNKAPINQADLRTLNALVERNAGRVEPDDFGRWVELFKDSQIVLRAETA